MEKICWKGEDGLNWRAEMGILDQKPAVLSLAYEKNGAWTVLEENLVPEFHVVTSKRTKNNPQRAMALKEGEELDYQWDTYSDDPFGHPQDVKQADEQFASTTLSVRRDGAHTIVTYDGLTLGQFSGGVEFHFFDGTNLIRMEAVASTQENGVAYLYHAGLAGLKVGKLYYISPKRREIYENPGLKTHSGPDYFSNKQRVDVRGRVLTLGTKEGSIAAFPSPHRFFWGSQCESIVGYHYYRYEYRQETMSMGIRHNMQQEHFNVRWPGYNAKPGTEQHMGVFFMPTAESVWVTRAMVMKYTNFDHLRQLPGYLRMGAHMHIATHAAWIRDTRKQRPWELLAKENGFDIFAPCDFWAEGNTEDNRELRKDDLERYQGMATSISDRDFLVVPAEEVAAWRGRHELIRYHCMYFPAKPTLYSRWREDDQSFKETLPDGRTYYHMASAMDFVNMAKESGGFLLMPHPDTKANDGLPYDCKDEEWFKSPIWWGIGCRQLPADNSVDTMISGRTERVWNDINNWADRPKYIMSELDTYTKVEEREEDWELYNETNCTYVQLDEVPDGKDWTPLVEALKAGRHFYSTGEILLENCSIQDGSADCTFSWTYPLRYVQIVYSDGENVTNFKIPQNDCVNFGKKSFHFDFPKGMKWARVLASDIAGNSAFGMPVFLRDQQA